MEYDPSYPDGLSCRNCPEGKYEEGTTTETYERDGTVMVVRNVPAYVCDLCGDSLIGTAELNRIQQTMRKIEDLNVESLVWDYSSPEEVLA